MSTNKQQEQAKMVELLNKLQKHVDRDPQFSQEDLKVINDMLQAWRGWVALGRVAKWIVITLGLIAGGIASWNALVKHAQDWIVK